MRSESLFNEEIKSAIECFFRVFYPSSLCLYGFTYGSRLGVSELRCGELATNENEPRALNGLISRFECIISYLQWETKKKNHETEWNWTRRFTCALYVRASSLYEKWKFIFYSCFLSPLRQPLGIYTSTSNG